MYPDSRRLPSPIHAFAYELPADMASRQALQACWSIASFCIHLGAMTKCDKRWERQWLAGRPKSRGATLRVVRRNR